MSESDCSDNWQFWIDRGGTFTDIVGLTPAGIIVTDKLLSEDPLHYTDAAVEGIRRLLSAYRSEFPYSDTSPFVIKMGTTVATNALLERDGDDTLLVITRGFADALRIGYQNRPKLFDLGIRLPDMLYKSVIEIDERISVQGDSLISPDPEKIVEALTLAFNDGFQSVAIVLMHGYRYPAHEKQVADLARDIGFSQISTSHESSPLIKLVSRGDTTVVDAYLSPILRRYVGQVSSQLGEISQAPHSILFMQSNGGLIEAHRFAGKDAILSGPAGGVVGMVETATTAGFDRLIGFDMGGTSTDVCHYAGQLERAFETEVAGVRLRAPMMKIHTVAAGGGSVCQFDGARYRVGPDSAGANPGPVCYGNGGPLAVTDCNVMLGRIQPDYFPRVFGESGDRPLSKKSVEQAFAQLTQEISRATNSTLSAIDVALGFLSIAVENMANAIKKISVQRGYDVSTYTLCCFGGAGGQHACRVADALGMKNILMHPLAGVLSAYGMGLADLREILQHSIDEALTEKLLMDIEQDRLRLMEQGSRLLLAQNIRLDQIEHQVRLHCYYEGSDTRIVIGWDSLPEMVAEFERNHQRAFGFIDPAKAIQVQSIEVESIARQPIPEQSVACLPSSEVKACGHYPVYFSSQSTPTPFYLRESLPVTVWINGPAVIIEKTGTLVVEPGWRVQLKGDGHLLLERYQALPKRVAIGTDADPVMLEIFNNLFMSIAEQMGSVLENTAYSVNIKERLDFSCAIFDPDGNLVANAPHMPVHLGSMSESIKTVIRENRGKMQRGDAFVLNAPYNGGTHLPDITVVKPVFGATGVIIFYVASRGHHADIGGITPGSMPADSTRVEEEGVLLDNLVIVRLGVFQENSIRHVLAVGSHPARNIDTNIADFKAQLAACEKGMQELLKIIEQYGLQVVQAYMCHVQNNAEESVRRVLEVLSDGQFRYETDDGSGIQVAIRVDKVQRRATIDFGGTSDQHPGNFNAPSAIARAAVLYVFRCLVDGDIPLNEGCLKPLDIILPSRSMINPEYPAAVVAGNVETSQVIVDALFGALGVCAAAQGTMNNVTWGNQQHQYYETLCGGEGASKGHDGCSAVHTHMTNSRLTDPEVLESRYPVLIEEFSIRRGSGGRGQFDGGDGIVRRTRFNESMRVSLVSGHRQVPPYGLAGGESGQCGENRLEKADGQTVFLSSSDSIEAETGDVLVIETPGGGGWGVPE